MIQSLPIDIALGTAAYMPVLDIRSPGEYAKGHIPGALSLPLFNDQERAVVGTAYHQEGREAAILKGFDITGPQWSAYIRTALELAPDKKVILHCWRGGMRSEAMAWALHLYGFEVSVIKGGYKAFRRWAHQVFNRSRYLIVLAGKTGSNKTGILAAIRQQGEQVLDLEALACHQGSAFGSMGYRCQPTQEQFENDLAWALKDMDAARKIWIEDESITIGRCAVPAGLWQQLLLAPAIELEVPLEARVALLTRQYGVLDPGFLESATGKIQKRLGPDQTRMAIGDIHRGDMPGFIRRVLTYYDKAYLKSRKPAADKSWTLTLPVEPAEADAAHIAGLAARLIGLAGQYSASSRS